MYLEFLHVCNIFDLVRNVDSNPVLYCAVHPCLTFIWLFDLKTKMFYVVLFH